MSVAEKVKIMVERCHPEARIPDYAHPGDAGMDLYAVEEEIIGPGKTVLVRTGLKVALPVGYELQVRPRSGLSLKSPGDEKPTRTPPLLVPYITIIQPLSQPATYRRPLVLARALPLAPRR